MLLSTMPNIRKSILAELDRRAWSKYQLAKAVKGKVAPDTVYKFLAGTRHITDKFLGPILDALELEISRK